MFTITRKSSNRRQSNVTDSCNGSNSSASEDGFGYIVTSNSRYSIINYNYVCAKLR
jgi:hypothetical protein